MKIETAIAAPLMLLTVLFMASASGQSVVAGEPQRSAETNAIRVIRDPHTAMRWLLERDPARPGGPGRMVLLREQEGTTPDFAQIANGILKKHRNIATPVIRNGDRVVVEENSAVVEARLEAVALDAAVNGAELRVRLSIGGKILRAVAIGPGRAAFAANVGRR